MNKLIFTVEVMSEFYKLLYGHCVVIKALVVYLKIYIEFNLKIKILYLKMMVMA